MSEEDKPPVEKSAAEEFLADKLKKMSGLSDKESIARLLKEAVLAQERHNDLQNIKSTLEAIVVSMAKEILDIGKSLVLRIVLAIGSATIWLTFFLSGMRDSTRDLQKQMIDMQSSVANVAAQLEKTADLARDNAAAIREIIIRSKFEEKKPE